MRIALLTYSTKPRGGVVHTLELAEALARQGQDVTVWALGRGAFFRPVDPAVGVRLVAVPEIEAESVGDRIVRSIALFGAEFDRSSYDIVHAQDCLSANAAGPGVIRTVHHLDRFTTPELAACHERAIVEPVAHVCVSRAVAAQLRAGWGIDPLVVPNGVDAVRFAAASPGRWRDELGRYVLTVGGIEPRKGTLDLVRAMARVRDQLPDVRLVVAGGETLFDYRDYRAAVEAEAARLGVEPVVLGPVAHDDLPALMASAAAFAFPSTNEGFGLAAMEALATGVPLVTRDLPVFREVFGAAARYATDPRSLADTLIGALTIPDPARCERGRQVAGGYSWDSCATAHLDFYRARLRAAA